MTPAEKKLLDESNARMKMTIEQKAAWFEVLVKYELTVSHREDIWMVNCERYNNRGPNCLACTSKSLLGAVKALCFTRLAGVCTGQETAFWQELNGHVYGLVEPDGSFDLNCDVCKKPAIGVVTVLGYIKHNTCEQCLKDGIMPMETLKKALVGGKREDTQGWTAVQIANTCAHFGKSVDEFWAEHDGI